MTAAPVTPISRDELVAKLEEIARCVKRVDEIADELGWDHQVYEFASGAFDSLFPWDAAIKSRVQDIVGNFSWSVVEDADDLLAILAFAEDRLVASAVVEGTP